MKHVKPKLENEQPWCGNCDHHKRGRSFKESCPRVKELFFKGGDKSATQILEDTKAHGCTHHIVPTYEQPKKE